MISLLKMSKFSWKSILTQNNSINHDGCVLLFIKLNPLTFLIGQVGSYSIFFLIGSVIFKLDTINKLLKCKKVKRSMFSN